MSKNNKSKLSTRNRKLRYDFLPPMLEIMERPANPAGTFLIKLVIVITVSTVIWASVFKLDIAVTAQGVVMPKDELVAVKSLSSGIIDKVYVTDSDIVNFGDAIISLENDQLEMQLADLKYDLEVMNVQYEVYSKLQAGDEPETIKVEAYKDNKNIAKAIVAEQELYESQLKEYDRAALGSKEYQNLRDSFVKEHELNLIQNVNSLSVKIHDTESSIKKLEKQIEDSIITAAEDGKITQLKSNLDGTVLQAGENVCYIIPIDSQMQFQAYVADRDIKDIHVGDKVNVKLFLYRDTDDEIVTGIVTKISDVAVTTQAGATCYLVNVELEKTDGLVEHIGSEGTCDILVGTRSVLDYFLEPLKKGIKDSLKES